MAEQNESGRYHMRPHLLFLVTLGSVFVIELLIMVLLRTLPELSILAEALLDACLLTILVLPFFFYFFLDPIKKNIRSRHLFEIENKHIQESNRIKSEFIAMASHELRTPLTSITGYSELLLMENKFDINSQKEFATIINEKAEAMERLIEELLDFSRIEFGHSLAIKKNTYDIVSTIESIVNVCRVNYPQRPFKVKLPETPVSFPFDKVRIEQVLDNILNNALKFSPAESPIEIEGALRNEYFHVQINDQGIGMSSDELGRIFDKFFRANTSGTSPSGLGLGMTIVKEIIALHSGELWLESICGTGTTVNFTIPASGRQQAL